MTSLRVRIVRFVDAGFPGFVECELVDVRGVMWSIIEKVVTNELLDANSAYPRATSIACEVVQRSRGSDGREVVCIDTSRPWGLEARAARRSSGWPPSSSTSRDRNPIAAKHA